MKQITLQDLVDNNPGWLAFNFCQDGSSNSKDLIQTLAACGYRFAEIPDIIRAQKSECTELKDFLSCQIVKIEQCL